MGPDRVLCVRGLLRVVCRAVAPLKAEKGEVLCPDSSLRPKPWASLKGRE